MTEEEKGPDDGVLRLPGAVPAEPVEALGKHPAARRTSVVDGREVDIIDGLLAVVLPLAQSGDLSSVDRVMKLLEMRSVFARRASFKSRRA